MPTRDRSILVIRILVGLHGLPLLVGFLGGVFLVLTDLLDDGGGVNDGLAVVVGSLVMVGTGVPLMLVVPCVLSRNRVVVRALGLVVGVVSMGCACVLGHVDLAHLALLLPGLALCAVSICSAFAAYGDPPEPPHRRDVPIRLKGGAASD
ncbi:hypothetical protein [Nocardioides plantarum]|uniref:Transmembrane protein n=1 Tax=Nocardioides plantarum TaxID=29299 RepID=A0ABV5K9H1_9ACTN|nr:hypothetical protein [Nocardioides plantarum]